jgi:DNA-directed RNA polymerase subunit B
MLVSQEDLPYTEEGIVPDIMINPHAFPSRMTVGQFMESLAGKSHHSVVNQLMVLRLWEKNSIVSRPHLKNKDFKYTERKRCMMGELERNSRMMHVGVVYYQKLHHMVADKIHSRARGQWQMLTKQPTEGRARGGGLRFGEMERDCLIAYGASMMLKDRLLRSQIRLKLTYVRGAITVVL